MKQNFPDPRSPTFGVEFLGTSVTSRGNGSDRYASDAVLAQNPHILFSNDYRGYVRCQVTPEQWRADYRVVPFVTEPGASISTRESFVFNGDRTGLHGVSIPEPSRGAWKDRG